MSPELALLVILARRSTTALPEPGEHRETSICPNGEPSQSCDTSALIPNVLCIVKTIVLLREELPELVTSISMVPKSSSARSLDGLIFNSNTCVACLSKKEEWKVPSPTSSKILSPVLLS